MITLVKHHKDKHLKLYSS